MSTLCILNLPMIDTHNLRLLKISIEEELRNRENDISSPPLSPRADESEEEDEQCFDLEDSEGNLVRAPKRTPQEEQTMKERLDNELAEYMESLELNEKDEQLFFFENSKGKMARVPKLIRNS